MTDSIEERVGRAAHERWKLWIVESGYADHAWPEIPTFEEMLAASPGALRLWVPCCELEQHKHHPDMVRWEELPEEKRGKYVGPGMAGYEIGLRRGQEIGVSDGRNREKRRIQHEINQGRFPR